MTGKPHPEHKRFERPPTSSPAKDASDEITATQPTAVIGIRNLFAQSKTGRVAAAEDRAPPPATFELTPAKPEKPDPREDQDMASPTDWEREDKSLQILTGNGPDDDL